VLITTFTPPNCLIASCKLPSILTSMTTLRTILSETCKLFARSSIRSFDLAPTAIFNFWNSGCRMRYRRMRRPTKPTNYPKPTYPQYERKRKVEPYLPVIPSTSISVSLSAHGFMGRCSVDAILDSSTRPNANCSRKPSGTKGCRRK
jgi:hypothetical protein